MKLKFNLLNFLYTLVMCIIFSAAIVPVVGPSGFVISAAILLYSLMPMKLYPDGCLRNEVLKRAFTSDLQEKLYPENSFFNTAQSDSGIGIDVEEVEIPQDEDGEAQSVVNPTKFPLETYEEEDKKKTYGADLIATKPQRIGDLKAALLSYDVRAAKLRKHQNKLVNDTAERILFNWGATNGDFLKQTTGTDTRAAHAPGATGNRKRATASDILYFMSMFNDLEIPLEGRRLVAPAYMYEDLMKIMETLKTGNDSVNTIVEKGAFGQIYGFNVFMRARTPVYTEASTPVKKAIGAASATTDNQSIVFFHPNFVRYIKGNVKVYLNVDQGNMLGTTLNASVRGGGTISRLSEIGVAALVEDNG